ncbi:hypothetical protein LUZ60_006857 [Juncus effusus]|nr:hypothetical protein LUZ60_006857 [Juncus effusus]
MISSARLKERGGGGGKVMATKPGGGKTLDKSPPEKLRSVRKSAPVVNAGVRSVSAGRRRDPTPNRVEKPAGAVVGVRKSTSSVPRSRGGAVNPSDFSRFVSGVRGSTDRARETRVSGTDRLGRPVGKDGEPEIGLRRSGNGGIRVSGSDGSRGKSLGSGSIRVLEKCSSKSVKKSDKIVPGLEARNKKETLRDIAKINGETRKNTVLSVWNENCVNSSSIDTITKIETDPKNTLSAPIPTFTVKWTYTNTNNSSEKQEKKESEEAKVLDKVRIFEKKIDNSSNSLGQTTNNNYPSKLHEKLALLEGRVQKIASEIRKTKEILDDGNPDESKLILSEIQNKISSVEKAVGKTLISSSDKTLISTSDKTLVSKPNPNYPSKGLLLNCQELESRFFPHQKLMKDPKPKTLIDEKSIEVEFLASLSGTKANTNTQSTSQNSMPISNPLQPSTTSSLDIDLRADERIEELDSRETKSGISEESDELAGNELRAIGKKNATGGWFVGEGEAVLLTQSDGSCLYYDIVNCEEKCEYRPPKPVPLDTFTDCWLVRAAGTDGCSGRYVIATSSGPSPHHGFCTWDFYKNAPTSFLLEDSEASQQSWYRPCGPLVIRATSRQKSVSLYDIRDGDLVMKWENNNLIGEMEKSSPAQWRSRGKVVICGNESVSLWDVNSVNAEPVLTFGNNKRVLAMHVCNKDAEIGGGVRQRVSSSEAEGNDGVFSTQDSINLMDFRIPTGTSTKIPRQVSGSVPTSIFSRGDSIFVGTNKSRLEHYSVRKGKMVMSWDLEIPDLENWDLGNRDLKAGMVSQVWGSGEKVMGVCGKGMFVFDGFMEGLRERIGGDNDGGVLERPSFDYSGSRVLLVSKDRPAFWRYIS